MKFSVLFKKQADKFSLLLIFLLSLTNAKGQHVDENETFSVSGTVKSSADSTGIPFAHVFLAEEIIGTVANSEGEFELKIPIDGKPHKLSFSAIGYKGNGLIASKDTVIIFFMDEVVQLLHEVVVTSNKLDSASYIFETAVSRINFNYPRKAHLMEGFYRELSYKDTVFTRLIEAAVAIQEDGYQKDYFKNRSLEETKSRAKIIELRKSDDFREQGLADRLMVRMLGERNELYKLLRNNYVRTFETKAKKYIMSIDLLRKSGMHYVGQTEFGGEPVYIIDVVIPQATTKVEIRFYINKKDFAFLKIERTAVPSITWKGDSTSLIEGKYYYKMEITYRKWNDKYYVFFIQTNGSDYDASYTAKLGDKTVKQFKNQIFLLTNIYEDDYSKIKRRKAEEQNKDIYKKDMQYNPVFWDNYNTVKINPLKRLPTELQKEKSLEEQFKGANKKND